MLDTGSQGEGNEKYGIRAKHDDSYTNSQSTIKPAHVTPECFKPESEEHPCT